jgi:hypothetical protein
MLRTSLTNNLTYKREGKDKSISENNPNALDAYVFIISYYGQLSRSLY